MHRFDVKKTVIFLWAMSPLTHVMPWSNHHETKLRQTAMFWDMRDWNVLEKDDQDVCCKISQIFILFVFKWKFVKILSWIKCSKWLQFGSCSICFNWRQKYVSTTCHIYPCKLKCMYLPCSTPHRNKAD